MSKRFLWLLLAPGVACAAVLLTAGGAASGGQEGVTGNNLSHPVIWGEPAALTLRGTYLEELWGGAFFSLNNVTYYVNGDYSQWQAESKAAYPVNVNVTSVDWGDNLESMDWRTTSKVRVETVLFRGLGSDSNGDPITGETDAKGVLHSYSTPYWPDPMIGYAMYSNGGAKLNELFGTNTNEKYLDGTQATVYSDHARLTIQLIDPGHAAQLVWDAQAGKWVDSVDDGHNAVLRDPPDFNRGCWEGVAGVGAYSAEINASGKVIYGFNWDVRATSQRTAGTYRLTFSLDPVLASGGTLHPSDTSGLNTFFDLNTYIRPMTTEGETESLLAAGAGPGGGPGGGSPGGPGKGGGGGGGGPTKGGGTAQIVLIDKDGHPAYLTYIDVLIK